MTIGEPVHQAGHDLAVRGGGAELEELGECIAELAAQISAATFELLAMLRDFDERGGWASGFHSCAKVRALTRIATPATEQDLLDFGRAGTAAHVERLVRGMRRVDRIWAGEKRLHASRYLRAYTDEDGMVVVTGRLAPEAGAALLRALEAGVEARESAIGGPKSTLSF